MEPAFKRGMGFVTAILPKLSGDDRELPLVVKHVYAFHTAEEIATLPEAKRREIEAAKRFEVIKLQRLECHYRKPTEQELQKLWEDERNKPMDDYDDFPF